MSWRTKYVLALLPAIATLGGWQLDVHLFDSFGCQGDIKHLQPCLAGTLDLRPWFGLGLFWLPLASLLSIPLSAGLVTKVALAHWKTGGVRRNSERAGGDS